MVSNKFLSYPENCFRVTATIIMLGIVAVCVSQNIFRMANVPLIEITSIENMTVPPIIQFCLLDLNEKGAGGFSKIDSALGNPGANNGSLNSYIYNLANDNATCAVFNGTNFPPYKSSNAPYFGFVITPAGNLTAANGIIQVSVYGTSVDPNDLSNVMLMPLGYQYTIQYSEIQFLKLDEDIPRRFFTFEPFVPLGGQQSYTNGTTSIYLKQRETNIEQQTEYSAYTFWDFVTGFGGLVSFLLLIYAHLFGNFRFDPWGLLTRCCLYRWQAKYYRQTAKEDSRAEIPFLEDDESMFEIHKGNEIAVLKQLIQRQLALERVLANYVIKTDVVDKMYKVGQP